jgi:hypothetical protein
MTWGPYALDTAENESWSAKHEIETRCPSHRRKWDPTLSEPPKTSLGSENMKTGADALGTVENEFGSVKYENRT